MYEPELPQFSYHKVFLFIAGEKQLRIILDLMLLDGDGDAQCGLKGWVMPKRGSDAVENFFPIKL